MACSGHQVCKADGTGFDECICGDGGTTVSASSASATSGTGGDTTSGSPTSSSAGTGGSGGSGGSGGAAPFSPADLPGLSLWLDTDTGIVKDPQNPGFAIKWQDQSSYHHLATANADITIDPVAANGHDALVCYNGAFDIPDHPSLRFGTGDFLIGMVVSASGLGSQYRPRFFTKSQDMALEAPANSMFSLTMGTDAVAGIAPPSAFHLVLTGRKGSQVFLNVDDSTSTSASSMVNVDNIGADVAFCDRANGNNGEIHMVAMVAVKGPTTETDYGKLAAYFKTRFGL